MSIGAAPGDLRHLSLRAARAGADAIREARGRASGPNTRAARPRTR